MSSSRKTSSLSPSPSISSRSSENNLLSILSISSTPPSLSLISNPNSLESSPLQTTPLSSPLQTTPLSSPLQTISPSSQFALLPAPVPACAACKYQRRKCGASCPLAPYFPTMRHQQFLNVHRLFGVSNVLKTLKAVKPEEKQDAIESLIFEADAHARDPSGGCLRIVLDLEKHLNMLNEEFAAVKSHLGFFRGQTLNFRGINSANEEENNAGQASGSVAISPENENQIPSYPTIHEEQEEQRFYDYFSYNNNNSNYSNNNNKIMNANIIEKTRNYDSSGKSIVHVFEDRNTGAKRGSEEDEIRPFVDLFGSCRGNDQDDQEKLVQNGETSTVQCNLGLGFSSF